MKFKLDENLDVRLSTLFEAAGHDAATVIDESLQGAVDPDIWAACVREQRALVTQDLGFGNVLSYSAEGSPGIVVLRGPHTRFAMQRELVETLLQGMGVESPSGRLWIVEPGRVRIRKQEGE